jgi:hypothetical protein
VEVFQWSLSWVGFGAFHPGVNKGAGKQGEGVPIDEGRERGIEAVTQKGGSVLRIGKCGAKEFVVRLMDSSGMEARARRKRPQPRTVVSRA